MLSRANCTADRLSYSARCFLNLQVVEYRVQYDGDGSDVTQCQLTAADVTKTCTVTVSVDQDMKQPVYVYYELQNFYQNHRRYVKSRSDQQLSGTVYSDASQLVDCDPLRTRDVNGTEKVLDPCGLIANSFFNGERNAAESCSSSLTYRCYQSRSIAEVRA